MTLLSDMPCQLMCLSALVCKLCCENMHMHSLEVFTAAVYLQELAARQQVQSSIVGIRQLLIRWIR